MGDPSNPEFEVEGPEYTCPKHGVSRFYMEVEFYNDPKLVERYCMRCFCEALEKMGVQKVQ